MNKNQMKIVDCFTELIVYTLEFKKDAQNEIFTIEKLVSDYTSLIEKLEDDFDIANVTYQEALFPVVAWIDEVILSSNKSDKKLWRKELLQKRFFNTSNAGYEFFERLEKLDSQAFELRLLYIYSLFLGFKGRYYSSEDAEKLKKIFETNKNMLSRDFLEHFPKKVFRNAYAQNELPSKKSFGASYKNFWIFVFVSLVIGATFYLVSQNYLNSLLEQYSIF